MAEDVFQIIKYLSILHKFLRTHSDVNLDSNFCIDFIAWEIMTPYQGGLFQTPYQSVTYSLHQRDPINICNLMSF